MIEIQKIKKERHMKNINFSYSAFLLVITALVVSLTGCGQKQELDPRTQPELVRIVEIGSSSGADPAFTGVVSARVQSNLGFRVPGKITSRLVDTGQYVRAGQLLMTIDRTDYVHALPREQRPSLQQRQRLIKRPRTRPAIALWSKAARFPLPSTTRSRLRRMRRKLSSLPPKPRSRSRKMRVVTHNLLRMRTGL